ncbi:MAG: S-methyl-5'-thioinosine phosphorylase [Granulosicoccus sp.]|nr:S-methyl-5'-thioinosine phosphorylase [Granulosicoccus sp.]
MVDLAIIGGTGLSNLDGFEVTRREMIKTPYGSPSGPLLMGKLDGHSIAFLARHGHKHSIPPHRVNYCANIWALEAIGVKRVLAVAAVGGIAQDCSVGRLVVPDQIIDYTYNRDHTFFDGLPDEVQHIDFSYPYDEPLRQWIINAANVAGVEVVPTGTYGATQGPRLETAAEIRRMNQDGCTVVGMTGMPEASLARELDLAYACCAVVVNPAAGISGKAIDVSSLGETVESSMKNVRAMILQALKT